MATRFADMFVDPANDTRPDPAATADEMTLLRGFLDWQRETLALKCQGLDPAELASRPIPFSNLSLLGLVRHLSDVERRWFRVRMAGGEAPRLYGSDADPDADFEEVSADPALVDEAFRAWRAEVDAANAYVSQAGLDDAGHEKHRGKITLRYVMLHLVEEYARHNGHADLIRQGIDGAVGQ